MDEDLIVRRRRLPSPRAVVRASSAQAKQLLRRTGCRMRKGWMQPRTIIR